MHSANRYGPRENKHQRLKAFTCGLGVSSASWVRYALKELIPEDYSYKKTNKTLDSDKYLYKGT